jgi:antitoxin PrlF
MSTDVLTMSSKGQIVIPSQIRKNLQLDAGDRFAVYARDNLIVLSKIQIPSEDELSLALDEAQEWARRNGLSSSDVDDAIAAARSREKKAS